MRRGHVSHWVDASTQKSALMGSSVHFTVGYKPTLEVMKMSYILIELLLGDRIVSPVSYNVFWGDDAIGERTTSFSSWRTNRKRIPHHT